MIYRFTELDHIIWSRDPRSVNEMNRYIELPYDVQFRVSIKNETNAPGYFL